MSPRQNKADFRKFYWSFGIGLKIKGTDQLMGNCPFCGKENHFFVYTGATVKNRGREKASGMFNCRRCGKSGNHYSFFRFLQEGNLEKTDYTPLVKNRGIKAETFQHEGIFQDQLTGTWYIPCYNAKGTINNLYKVDDEGNILGAGRRKRDAKLVIKSSPSPCSHHLYRGHTLTKTHKKIWVVEGHWDTLVLLEVFAHLNRRNGRLVRRAEPNWRNEILKNEAVVGVPGATTFKDEWAKSFRGKHIILCYDNDQAGQTGIGMVKNCLYENSVSPESLEVLIWQKKDTANDLRDLLAL